MEEINKMLEEGAPIKKLRASNRPILIPPSVITNTKLSRHLVGVYVSLLYMLDRHIYDIHELGMEDKRFETNIHELEELGLVTLDVDGTITLKEIC